MMMRRLYSARPHGESIALAHARARVICIYGSALEARHLAPARGVRVAQAQAPQHASCAITGSGLVSLGSVPALVMRGARAREHLSRRAARIARIVEDRILGLKELATHVLTAGYDIRPMQELLGHTDVAPTMNYTHELKLGSGAVRSPIGTMNM